MASYSWLKVRCEARSIDQEARQERSVVPEQAVVGGAHMDRGKGRQGPEGRDCRRRSEALLGRAFRSPRAGHRVLHQHQLGARGTFEFVFVFVFSVIFAYQLVSGVVEVSSCKARKRFFGCKCTYATTGSWLKSSRAPCQVLFSAGRAKGTLSPTHCCKAHTPISASDFTCQISCLFDCNPAAPVVQRTFLHVSCCGSADIVSAVTLAVPIISLTLG
jgi:hypothetical protein